jgi:hypothetical protein
VPLRSDIRPVRLAGWGKGLNVNSDAARLEADELAVADNVDIGQRGELTRREGHARIDGSVVTTEVGKLFYGIVNSKNEIVAVDVAGQFWKKQDAGAWASQAGITFDALGTDADAYFVGAQLANGSMYFTQKGDDTETPRKWNGTAWSTVATIPKARYLLWKDGRLMAANDTTRPSAVYFSNLNDPETWGASDYVEFDPDDGEEIEAISQIGDDLVVFKQSSVQILAGKTPEDYARYVVNRALGTQSGYTVRQFQNAVIFYDRETGVWLYDGAKFNLISEAINPDILGSTKPWHDFAWVKDDRYYLSITKDDNFPTDTYVWHAETGGWSKWDLAFKAVEPVRTASLTENKRWYAGSIAEGVGVDRIFNSYTDDDGAAIPLTIKTGWLAPYPGRQTRLRRLEALFGTFTSTTVTIKAYRDFDTAALATKTLNLDPSQHGSLGTVLYPFTGWGNRWDHIALEFTIASGAGFSIANADLFMSVIGDIRGIS